MDNDDLILAILQIRILKNQIKELRQDAHNACMIIAMLVQEAGGKAVIRKVTQEILKKDLIVKSEVNSVTKDLEITVIPANTPAKGNEYLN
jgi:hypothetical protein